MVKECLVYLDLEVNNMEGFLNAATDIISKTDLIDNKEKFLKALIKREQEITTGVGKGVAFPHASGSFVKYPFIALFRIKKAIDFKSIDERPVDLFFVIGTPNDTEEIHLKILSRLAQSFAESDFKEELRESNDPKLIKAVLKNIFKPMIIIVYNNEEEKHKILTKFSPRANFYFYRDGNRVEPFEIHISDLAIAIDKPSNNRLIPKTLNLLETMQAIDQLLLKHLSWEDN